MVSPAAEPQPVATNGNTIRRAATLQVGRPTGQHDSAASAEPKRRPPGRGLWRGRSAASWSSSIGAQSIHRGGPNGGLYLRTCSRLLRHSGRRQRGCWLARIAAVSNASAPKQRLVDGVLISQGWRLLANWQPAEAVASQPDPGAAVVGLTSRAPARLLIEAAHDDVVVVFLLPRWLLLVRLRLCWRRPMLLLLFSSCLGQAHTEIAGCRPVKSSCRSQPAASPLAS